MMDVTNFISFQIHGAADNGESFAQSVADFLAFIEGLLTKEPNEIFAAIMPGVAALENIHPLLVHFPIAFLTGFFLLDLVGTWIGKKALRDAAEAMLYFGVVGAAITVAAGFAAAETVAHSEQVHDIMERHEHIGVSVLTMATVLSLWRLVSGSMIHGAANFLFLTLAGIMCIVMMLGADLGGLMVYRYGIAVSSQTPAVTMDNVDNATTTNQTTKKHSHSHSGHSHDHSHTHSH